MAPIAAVHGIANARPSSKHVGSGATRACAAALVLGERVAKGGRHEVFSVGARRGCGGWKLYGAIRAKVGAAQAGA